MSAAPRQVPQADGSRPIGLLQPSHERAVRALKAIREDRLEDAAANALALPDQPPLAQAWKLYLQGRVAFERSDLSSAERCFHRAAIVSLCGAFEAGADPCGEALRLAAEGFEHLGRTHRRRERIDEALRAHRVALALRREHGSSDEQWESAFAVGLDGEVGRRWEDAVTGYRAAAHVAETTSQDAELKQARSWVRLSRVLLSWGRLEESVSAARQACRLFHEHHPGRLERFSAETDLGQALVRQAESIFDRDPAGARERIQDAVQRLRAAQTELAPYGDRAGADLQLCSDLLDFAPRLLESLSDSASV